MLVVDTRENLKIVHNLGQRFYGDESFIWLCALNEEYLYRTSLDFQLLLLKALPAYYSVFVKAVCLFILSKL